MWMMLAFAANSALNFVVSLLVAKFLGPAEYGRFVLALSASVFVQLLLFDWLRLATTRFYAHQSSAEPSNIRATLMAAFLWLAGFAAALALAAYLAGFDLPLSPDLAALAMLVAIVNGVFDIAGALLRARFLDRAYGALVVAKNVLAFTFTVGGAYLFHSAPLALSGLTISVAGALVAARSGLLEDPSTPPGRAEPALARKFVGYGMPIIAANLLYQSVPLVDRALVSQTLGFAEAGQLSLAYEIGIRIVGALGSALDVILFQLAVRDEKATGAAAGVARIGRNMGVVFALVAPAVLGCWLILPSFEALFVPESFRGPFARYFTLLSPTLLAFALINYAVNPAFQLAHRLTPLIVAALAAVLANLLCLLLAPATGDATNFALAQSCSSVAGLVALTVLLFALQPRWPSARDILGTLAACAAMFCVVAPLRALAPGAPLMAAQILSGGVVYAAVATLLDVAGAREILSARMLRLAAAK